MRKKKSRSLLSAAPTRRQLRRRTVIDKVVRLFLFSSQAIPASWRRPGRLEREALEILESR